MSPEAIEVVRQMAWMAMEKLDEQVPLTYVTEVLAKNEMAREALWALLDTLPPRSGQT